MFPIKDLHCDLLCYLAGDSQRTPYSPEVRCSIPQLIKGQVCLQVLPIFTETNHGSALIGNKQLDIFFKLPQIDSHFNTKTKVLLAIENASSISEECESLDEAFIRLEKITQLTKLVYISLTWNTENRFGGGALTEIGLKPDGQALLEYLNAKNIGIDLSHASDRLAFDILDYINAENLSLPILASHSNLRAVANVPRNLPDELAKEIIKKGGVIGFNFVRYFVGASSENYFSRQLEHFLNLGGEDAVCLGADFFFGEDVPLKFRKLPEELFFPEYDNSSCYSKVFHLWKQDLNISHDQLEKIANKNLDKFLKKIKIN